MKGYGKSLDIKGFAEAFGDAFDARGFAKGFRSAFDLGNAARAFVNGFRQGAGLLAKQIRRAIAAPHAATHHIRRLAKAKYQRAADGLDENVGTAVLCKDLRDEIEATLSRDPAARSRIEVVLCYPGFQALLHYRLAHWLWRHGWRLAGRFISNVGRMLTGVEIHPGARIGRRLFIDHGMGVVIGETAVIGDDCTLYQGVTLGGTSLERGQKRHPTLGNDVIVGSHAQILGPFRVGNGARISAAAVVLKEVPDGATMIGNPARQVGRRAASTDAPPVFEPYGISGDIPDPIARALNALLDLVASLRERVGELERERDAAPPSDESASTPEPRVSRVRR